MVIDPFATHVLRCILTLLSPALDSTVNATSHSSNLRSKKSTKWKNKQAPLISIFGDKQQFDIEENFNPPQAWASLPGAILSAFTTGQGGNEIRSLAISAAASPTLQACSVLYRVYPCKDSNFSLWLVLSLLSEFLPLQNLS